MRIQDYLTRLGQPQSSIIWTVAVGALLLTSRQLLAQSNYEPYAFITLSGGGGYSTNAAGSAARFRDPIAVAVDSAGNVYVAEQLNHSISKVTPAGVVTTLAGRPGSHGRSNGSGSAARFNLPSGTAVDAGGNVYVADTYNHSIRKVTPDGTVTTLAGELGSPGSANGTVSAARFREPFGVAVDRAGNVYVADTWNHTIRKVTPSGVVTTLAGLAGSAGSEEGANSDARFNGPNSVEVDNAGDLYVADTFNHTIRKMTLIGTEWVVTTLAGEAGIPGSADGVNGGARFNEPNGVALDSAGNLYVADFANNTIRKMTREGANWVVTTAAGLAENSGSANGNQSEARFNIPASVAVDSADNLYVADFGNNLIRKMTLTGENWAVATLAGTAGIYGSVDALGIDARFYGPSGAAVNRSGTLYVADPINHTIRGVTTGRGVVTTVAGLAGYGGSADGTGNDARFRSPSGVAMDSTDNVYVADTYNHTIRKVTPAGAVTTLAGQAGSLGSADGTGTEAQFAAPFGVAVDSAGNVHVADAWNNTIRKVTPGGVVTTVAGLAGINGSQNGTGSGARFNFPTSVAVGSNGNTYVADTLNHLIRRVTSGGVVTTLAGAAGVVGSVDRTGTAARFYAPSGIAVDSADNVYVADSYNNTIRKVTPSGVVTTLGGLVGMIGTANGIGSTARFGNPTGVAVDGVGVLYVTDFYFNTVRRGYQSPQILSPGWIGGEFRFNLGGPPELSRIVEASSDLTNWVPISTNTSPITVGDPQSNSFPSRFYRLRFP